MGSRALFQRAQEQAYFIGAVNTLAQGRMVPVPGGVLIQDGGVLLGAVGVSGDTSDNDEICAVAGIEAAGLKANAGIARPRFPPSSRFGETAYSLNSIQAFREIAMSIEVEWARMTAPDLRAIAGRNGALAILPAGSLEQHGPHLPVITDTASASAASIAAARLVVEGPDPVPVAVLPGLWLGLSEHHLPFGGTISVDYAAYRAILESIVRSLRALGFARLLIVNGHGGNIDPLAVASRELAVAYDFPIVATTPWFLASEKIAAIFESDTGTETCLRG